MGKIYIKNKCLIMNILNQRTANSHKCFIHFAFFKYHVRYVHIHTHAQTHAHRLTATLYEGQSAVFFSSGAELGHLSVSAYVCVPCLLFCQFALLYVCLSLSLSISISLLSLSICLSIYLSLSVSPYLSLFLSLSLAVSPYFSLSLSCY